MKRKLKQLASTLGAFGGMAGMIILTGATMNGHLTPLQFFIGMAILTIIVLGCVAYIDHNTEGGEWI